MALDMSRIVARSLRAFESGKTSDNAVALRRRKGARREESTREEDTEEQRGREDYHHGSSSMLRHLSAVKGCRPRVADSHVICYRQDGKRPALLFSARVCLILKLGATGHQVVRFVKGH